ncbi:MAG: thiamine phosphate synthase, partial [bacterium]
MVNSKIDWSLYAILDKEFIQNRSIPFLAEQVIAAGAGVVQLRDKISTTKEFYAEALAVKEITYQYGIPLIINDRLDIALTVNAEGVHLGQSDLPLKAARSIVGADMIIGVSVHNLAEFNAVVKNEPDYFGVGTIFPTKTKNKLQIMGT